MTGNTIPLSQHRHAALNPGATVRLRLVLRCVQLREELGKTMEMSRVGAGSRMDQSFNTVGLPKFRAGADSSGEGVATGAS